MCRLSSIRLGNLRAKDADIDGANPKIWNTGASVVARVDFSAILRGDAPDKEIDDSFRCTRDKFPADALIAQGGRLVRKGREIG